MVKKERVQPKKERTPSKRTHAGMIEVELRLQRLEERYRTMQDQMLLFIGIMMILLFYATFIAGIR